MSKAVRKRRQPEEARLEIMQVAQRRLREIGIGGLNVADVAKDCGMSHATVIHHFGSTGGMRRALVDHMTDALLRDVIRRIEESPVPDPPAILQSLFATLSEGGHVKLIAWLSLSGDEFAADVHGSAQIESLFSQLVPVVAQRLPAGHEDRLLAARRIVFLTATAAMGYGLGGETWAQVMGLSADEAAAFPAWLGEQINRMWLPEGNS